MTLSASTQQLQNNLHKVENVIFTERQGKHLENTLLNHSSSVCFNTREKDLISLSQSQWYNNRMSSYKMKGKLDYVSHLCVSECSKHRQAIFTNLLTQRQSFLGNDIVMNMLSNTKLVKTKIQFFTGVKHVQINFRHTDHKYFSMFSVQKVPQQTHSKVKVGYLWPQKCPSKHFALFLS